MPTYTVAKGRRVARDVHVYEEGDEVTLDEDVAQPLLDSGDIEQGSAKRRALTPKKPSSWTGDDKTDNSGGDSSKEA